MRSTLYKIGFLLFLFPGTAQLLAAAPALNADSLQVGAATITYRAQLSDTLSVVAEQLTGNKKNWVQLAKLNNIQNDWTILAMLGSRSCPAKLAPQRAMAARLRSVRGLLV